MKALKAEELLGAWEQGLNQPLLQRVLILLLAAYPEIQPDALVKLSVGQRDLHLLQHREHLFGPRLLNTALCPECGQRMEWENNIVDFVDRPDENNTTMSEFDLNENEYALRFRLPNSLDVAAVINSENTEKAQQLLLSRCVLKASRSGVNCDVAQLPAPIIQILTQRIEHLDPQADIRIQLNCPECSHSWDVLFDIASFLWTEINDWAEQMLQMVHKLATGYGWSEKEILNLSPVRRQLYLGMLGS